MTYNTLIKEMKAMNLIYPNRFRINKKEGTILIGEIPTPFSFTEETFDNSEPYMWSALDVINHYGMLKPNDECFGDELYYKGLKWDELSQEQRDSIINKEAAFAKNSKNVEIEKPEFWKQAFESDRTWLIF